MPNDLHCLGCIVRHHKQREPTAYQSALWPMKIAERSKSLSPSDRPRWCCFCRPKCTPTRLFPARWIRRSHSRSCGLVLIRQNLVRNGDLSGRPATDVRAGRCECVGSDCVSIKFSCHYKTSLVFAVGSRRPTRTTASVARLYLFRHPSGRIRTTC